MMPYTHPLIWVGTAQKIISLARYLLATNGQSLPRSVCPFDLVSNKEKNPFECLRKYHKRETIESFFEAGKQHADGTRVRVWDTDTLRGRMFVQFVSLCYYEYLNEEIRKLKQTLGKESGDAAHDTKAILDNELKLKSWLCNTPLYLQLQWFDTVESVDISVKLKSRRWTTEITSRDELYLQKLGVTIR